MWKVIDFQEILKHVSCGKIEYKLQYLSFIQKKTIN
jgi:hypothetical protein